jgi:hypothetical protein
VLSCFKSYSTDVCVFVHVHVAFEAGISRALYRAGLLYNSLAMWFGIPSVLHSFFEHIADCRCCSQSAPLLNQPLEFDTASQPFVSLDQIRERPIRPQ